MCQILMDIERKRVPIRHCKDCYNADDIGIIVILQPVDILILMVHALLYYLKPLRITKTISDKLFVYESTKHDRICQCDIDKIRGDFSFTYLLHNLRTIKQRYTKLTMRHKFAAPKLKINKIKKYTQIQSSINTRQYRPKKNGTRITIIVSVPQSTLLTRLQAELYLLLLHRVAIPIYI